MKTTSRLKKMLKMHSHLFRHPLPYFVSEERRGVLVISQTIGHLHFF